jgi:hypothetical protein
LGASPNGVKRTPRKQQIEQEELRNGGEDMSTTSISLTSSVPPFLLFNPVGLEMVSKPSATAPRPRRLRRRQTVGLVLNMAYGHASAPNRPSSLPRSTMAVLATRMVLKPSLGFTPLGFAPTGCRPAPTGFVVAQVRRLCLLTCGRMGCAHFIRPPPLGARLGRQRSGDVLIGSTNAWLADAYP